MGRPKVSCQPWYPGTLQSEYGAEYPKKHVDRDAPGQAKTGHLQYHTPFTAISTKQHDYPAWDINRANPFKPDVTPWPQRKADCTTTYNLQYPAKEVPRNRSQAYCELRSKKLDNNDYGTQGQPTYKEDYPGWPGAQPAKDFKPNNSAMPVRQMDGETDYAANYKNKHSGRPVLHKPGKTVDYAIPFSGCTTYGKDYIKKPIPEKYNACVDRPWMRCDSCPPSEMKTPDAQHLGGMPEKTWTYPPFAIGRAALDDRTEHKTKYLRW